MGAKGKEFKRIVALIGNIVNKFISFIIFFIFDLVDFLLCLIYKAIDFIVESEWAPCYCSSRKDPILIAGDKIMIVSEKGEAAKVFRLADYSSKLRFDDVSPTLYTRPSVVSDVARVGVDALRKGGWLGSEKESFWDETVRLGISVNSAVVEMMQGKGGAHAPGRGVPVPRWSDCECATCTDWISSHKNSLFVRVDSPKESAKGIEDVLFIHGFISSSKFWTETVFPNLSDSARSKYRLFAVDLLGFGRSPKPSDSLYTLREHVEMIERSVIEPYKVKNVHIVAHSLGCILALGLAVKHPDSIKSLTLLAPPYFGKPSEGEDATQHIMRRVAPRMVWPPIELGASIACWYEHISRTACIILSKHHRFWEFLLLQLSRHRIKQYLLEGFWCHTHHSAWHTLHNIICGSANKLDRYLDVVRDNLKCHVTIFHGEDDELIPVECSHNVQSKIPRARVKVIERKDHITIVVGREKEFARELEEVWRSSSS
ncbi:hypothetical protein V2J09_020122 [Rumex salicifolius]